jgi:hypothetical protein
MIRFFLLTLVEILSFVGVLVYFLFRIVNALEKIGGASTSFQAETSSLAQVRWGVAAIERETSHLGPQVTALNRNLTTVAGKLDVAARNLQTVRETLQGESEERS